MNDPLRMKRGSRTRRAARLGVVAILLGIGGSGCSGSEAGDTPPAAAEALVDEDAPGVYQVGPNEYHVTVLAFESGFNPSEIRVPVGAEVTFRVRAADQQWIHGFLIEGTPIELEVDSYQYYEGVHTFEEPGEYTFLCHLYCGGGHPEMFGKVIVE